VASLQAEAFSAAEVLHGPFALIQKNHPFLLLVQNDVTLPSVLDLADHIYQLGGQPFFAGAKDLPMHSHSTVLNPFRLPLPEALHPILDPLVAITAFYRFAARLALARGLNPDVPPHLKKVTETR
jgi:glucosamine--fructose-6-phosphate aminotransferase (isomerizing)